MNNIIKLSLTILIILLIVSFGIIIGIKYNKHETEQNIAINQNHADIETIVKYLNDNKEQPMSIDVNKQK